MKLYSFAKGIKRARKEAGYTQATLAEKLSIHIKSVMNWEQGIATPSLDMLLKLCDLYGCDLDYLTGRIDCKTHSVQDISEYTGLTEKTIETLHDWNQNPKTKNAITALNDLVECGMFFATRVLFKIKDYIILRAVSEGKPTVNIDLFDIETPEDERLFNQQIKEEKTIQNAKHLKELARFDLMNGLSDCVLTIYDRRKSVSK